MIYKESQSIESFMPVVYNKLKSLGEINNVVPLANILKGLQTGQARAYVSNEDRNQDGVPDNIRIVYPKIDMDLKQNMSGVTTADISAFPNIASQEIYGRVTNILAGVLEILKHEQDHLDGFTHGSGGHEEFGSESSAHQAGRAAAQAFINKYMNKAANVHTTNSIINVYNKTAPITSGEYKVKKELLTLATHLDSIGEIKLADRIDAVVKQAQFAPDNNASDHLEVKASLDHASGDTSEGDSSADHVKTASEKSTVESRVKKIANDLSNIFSVEDIYSVRR